MGFRRRRGYGRSSYWGFPPYVSVAEKKAKAEKKLKQLQKKNSDIKPVVIEGSSIARTWWGKAWNLNLEKYADYSNRIGRGRSYVRHGAVLDLQIKSGEIKSLVQGSTSNPYSILIKIENIKKDIWKKIKTFCEGKLDSLQGLLDGKFPKSLGEIFTAKGEGLFPSPKEIDFSCSCPDGAYMCKHIAATLYGVGARLDEDPQLFFKLRKAEIGELIKQTISGKTEKLLEKAKKKTSRVIDDSDLSSVFGIEMEKPAAGKERMEKKTAPHRKPAKRIPEITKKTTAKKATAKTDIKKSKKKSITKKKSTKASVPKKKKVVTD